MSSTAASPRARRLLLAFLGLTFASSLGSAAALLGATIVSSDAGSDSGLAATYTALMLALSYGVAAVVTPYANGLAARFGTRRVFAATYALTIASYALLATVIWAGIPAFPALLVATPFFGIAGGIGHVVSPPVVRAYCSGQELSRAEGWTSMASGLAWVIGALAGAVAIDAVGPAVAFLMNAMLTLPLLVLVLTAPPVGAIVDPATQGRPWRTMVGSVRHNPRLRRAAVLGVGTAVLLAPFASMVVPLTRDTGHELALHAGLVLAAVSLGAVLSPLPLRRAGSRHGPLRASAALYVVAALGFLVMAAGIRVWNGTPELIAVMAFAVVFGAAQTAAGNLLVQDAAESAEEQAEEQQDLAAYFLFVGLGVPVGSIVWAHLSILVSVPRLLAIVGAVAVVFAVGMLIHLNRLHIHRAPALKSPSAEAAPTPRHVPGSPGHLSS